MAKEQPAPKPDRVRYGLERRPGNTWVVVTSVLRGDTVKAETENEPDGFAAQMGRLDYLLRRAVM